MRLSTAHMPGGRLIHKNSRPLAKRANPALPSGQTPLCQAGKPRFAKRANPALPSARTALCQAGERRFAKRANGALPSGRTALLAPGAGGCRGHAWRRGARGPPGSGPNRPPGAGSRRATRAGPRDGTPPRRPGQPEAPAGPGLGPPPGRRADLAPGQLGSVTPPDRPARGHPVRPRRLQHRPERTRANR